LEYRVTVLPLPVGPVTSSSPCGALMQCFRVSKVDCSKPSLVRSTFNEVLSRIRSTTDSPNRVGRVETRKSTTLFLPTRILMRPSCGTRRSVMSRFARILSREFKAFLIFIGRFMDLYKLPSSR